MSSGILEWYNPACPNGSLFIFFLRSLGYTWW
jgi:hypothetical protein